MTNQNGACNGTLESRSFYKLAHIKKRRPEEQELRCLEKQVDGQSNLAFFIVIFHYYRKIHESANDGRWHHICVSWRNSDGAWQFYKDGTLHRHSSGLARGHTIRAGGSLVLGQDQDSVGGGFSSSQSFQGSLTNVNVWSYVLSASSIKNLSKSCLSGAGNVYMWSDFILGIKGKTAVVIPSPCSPLSY